MMIIIKQENKIITKVHKHFSQFLHDVFGALLHARTLETLETMNAVIMSTFKQVLK